MELVRDKLFHATLDYTKEFGNSAAVVLHLCRSDRLFGTKRLVIADSDFGNLRLARALRMNGLHCISNVKGGHGGFPKRCLVMKLVPEVRGSHVVATMKDECDEKFLAVGWRGKSDRMKGKKRKNHYITTLLSSFCSTTVPGPPAEKKRHIDGKRVESVFVSRPQIVADYLLILLFYSILLAQS